MRLEKLKDRELITLNEQLKEEFKKRNLTALKIFELKNRKKCPNCNKLIYRRSKLCRSCSAKNSNHSKFPKEFIWKTGKDNGRWVDGSSSYRNMIEITKCDLCGSTKKLEVHHKDENRKNNEVSNLQVLCLLCHRRKHPKNLKRNDKGRFLKNE